MTLDDPPPEAVPAARASLAIITEPGQANAYGTLHGGVLLRLADECGAIAALRHVGKGQITTAAIDSMTFVGPVYVGERVELSAEVTYVGRTSIETRIEIVAEPLERAEPRMVAVGYALYVALDESGRRRNQFRRFWSKATPTGVSRKPPSLARPFVWPDAPKRNALASNGYPEAANRACVSQRIEAAKNQRALSTSSPKARRAARISAPRRPNMANPRSPARLIARSRMNRNSTTIG